MTPTPGWGPIDPKNTQPILTFDGKQHTIDVPFPEKDTVGFVQLPNGRVIRVFSWVHPDSVKSAKARGQDVPNVLSRGINFGEWLLWKIGRIKPTGTIVREYSNVPLDIDGIPNAFMIQYGNVFYTIHDYQIGKVITLDGKQVVLDLDDVTYWRQDRSQTPLAKHVEVQEQALAA